MTVAHTGLTFDQPGGATVAVCGLTGGAGTSTVAYLIATVGRGLGGRTVAIASTHLGRFDWAFAAGALRVNLTRAAISASPPFQAEYAGPLLRADDLVGGIVDGTDQAAVGLVNDLLVDDVAWALRFLQVDVGDRMVLVPAAWIGRVDPVARAVRLVVDRAQVRASPPFAGKASPGPNLG